MYSSFKLQSGQRRWFAPAGGRSHSPNVEVLGITGASGAAEEAERHFSGFFASRCDRAAIGSPKGRAVGGMRRATIGSVRVEVRVDQDRGGVRGAKAKDENEGSQKKINRLVSDSIIFVLS